MRKSLGFTLAEVLITLAIIGVVAAMTIPSVIVNTNQAEFRTGLKKAVSVLNSSLTMNIALEGESPYDNSNLFGYLQQHMSVMKSTTDLGFSNNYAFYTTDGMRFEFPTESSTFKMHEDGVGTVTLNGQKDGNYIGSCGTEGLSISSSAEGSYPCMVLVDVNGDKKPNPSNASASNVDYTYPSPADSLLKDIFTIMITDDRAVPLGVVAQKAMYQSQK